MTPGVNGGGHLAGQKILITRPEQQGNALLKKLSGLGAEVVHYPVLEIVPLAQSDERRHDLKQLLMDLDCYHHIIFISTNAVAYGIEWMEQFWPQWPVGIQWYAIGMATAKALLRHDLVASSPTVAMNSEALLQIMDLRNIAEEKVLIVRGVGGREYLAERLRANGATVNYAECYQRLIPNKPAGELSAIIESQQITATCVNSGESLENLISLAGDGVLRSLAVVVPSERVAEMAEQQGFNRVIKADNASDDACIAALQQIAEGL